MSFHVRIAARLRPLLTPARQSTLRQFARFGVVGIAGFGVDVATVYLAKAALGLPAAGLLAYFTAVTATWALNRAWTFAGHGAGNGAGGMARQWLLFVAANAPGFVLNRGTFLLLVTLSPFCARHPALAIVAGVAAGLFSNFNLSRALVFPGARSMGARRLGARSLKAAPE